MMAKRGAAKSKRAVTSPRATLVSRSALCAIVGVTENRLVTWEREELLFPARYEVVGRRREPLYDSATVKRARLIRTLADELEVNLPGISVVLNLLDQMLA
jgi:DNA-binding transcriptional MerR regulator